jgi:hypothetical protein
VAVLEQILCRIDRQQLDAADWLFFEALVAELRAEVAVRVERMVAESGATAGGAAVAVDASGWVFDLDDLLDGLESRDRASPFVRCEGGEQL